MAVTIICGANQQAGTPGMKVSEIKDDFKEILNIADDAEALVNGVKVDGDYELVEGDTLEFVKKSGDKG